MNGNVNCAEIDVVGDCVSGIFDTPNKDEIDSTFSVAAKVSSLIDIMNYKFQKSGITEIKVGVGLAWGRALMIKAGYKGSGVNEVVWMGDVVNEASKLANYGNQTSSDMEIMVSKDFYYNLNDHNKTLLTWYSNRDCYHGNVINVEMDNWYKQNCR